MRYIVFDIESDGLLEEVSKIHCLSYQIFQGITPISSGTIYNSQEIVEFFRDHDLEEDTYFVGHRIIQYDFPVLKKILGIEAPEKLIDTLGLSYYLYPLKHVHGLDTYGKEVGIAKPKVEDWSSLTPEEYGHRCQEDVKINSAIFLKFMRKLAEIYDNVTEDMFSLILYINFKLDCLKEQEEAGITLNVEDTKKYLEELTDELDAKYNALSTAMPKHLGKLVKKRPVKMFKANGEVSALGIKWFDYLKENNLPAEILEVREDPNPGSNNQLKDWLFSLGWAPETFKLSKATGENVPQVASEYGDGLCKSVKRLYSVEPVVEELDNYYKIRHRAGIFSGYLDSLREDGKICAQAQGFTKTLRMAHKKPIANLPKPGMFYGNQVREVLVIPDEDHIMIGADISGLEDNTKRHYIFYYDPEYVETMNAPGFDPHIDIGVLAGLITKEEEEFFKKVEAMSDEEKQDLTEEEKSLYKSIKEKRGISKSANFAATYGAGGPKIADVTGVPLSEGYRLHTVYWTRNWAVKRIAEDFKTKTIGDTKYIQNPISGIWLTLTSDKDKFSAVNQNSGVYVFDTWVRKVRSKLKPLGIKICLQYHDELLIACRKEFKDTVATILREAMAEVNNQLKLNVIITISMDFGSNYKECH